MIFIYLILLSSSSILTDLEDELKNNAAFSDRGELIADIGEQFIGKPYLPHSLDKGDSEICSFDLNGFDCVTFYETAIALSELYIEQKEFNSSNITNELTKLRYIKGEVNGYESRLHYSSHWIIENTKRNKFEDITKILGGTEFNPSVSFMSNHPDKYSRLKGKPELTNKIKSVENIINKNNLYYIPTEYVENIENDLKAGDIIFFKTNIKGLDYAHTGMVYLDNSTPKLLHASSTKKAVVKDVKISEYLKNKKTLIGITILRPY